MPWQVWLPALLIALTLLACGAETPGVGSGFSDEVTANQLVVSADPKGALKWDRSTYEVKAGDVTFVVQNPSPIAHNFVVQGNGLNATSKNVKGNGSITVTLKGLQAGDYQIVCTIPGHREGGMVARLTVK